MQIKSLKGKRKEKRMKKKVFIIVDMQEDFVNGALGTPEAKAIVENVKKRAEELREDGAEAIVDGRGSTGDIENVSTAITAVTESYPELKSDKNYKTLMNELSITENLIAEYRSNYNKQVKVYKRYVRNPIKKMFLNLTGYEKQEYQYLSYDVSSDAPQNLFGEEE